MRRQSIPVFLPIIAFVMLACNAESVAGRYVLRSVGGTALPAEYSANADVHTRILADTLILAAGAGQERSVAQSTPDAVPYARVTRLVYEQRGDRLEITLIPECPPNANCSLARLDGRVTSAGIEIDDSNFYRTRLSFERAGP